MMTRRNKIIALIAAGAIVGAALGALWSLRVLQSNNEIKRQTEMTKPKVYFTRDISPAGLMQVYNALGRVPHGRVAVKISTGEPGGHNYLKPDLIGDFVKSVDGAIVECNTAYGGGRAHTADHLRAAAEHGFTAIAPVDIMDADGEIELPVSRGLQIKKNYVGSHFKNYDFWVILSHFKGHQMGGFGGALKNMAIGIASGPGKLWVHSAGKTKTEWVDTPQDAFLESMADAVASVIDSVGAENMIHINVLNNLSIDCDCAAHPADPEMADIGIMASLDPVALDRASVDAVYASPDQGKKHLCERIEKLNGTHILRASEKLGIGRESYELVDLDK
ncbi:hypothetical protein FACS189421_02830 [Bacteroidia bacterium]|nr:hypothetical protein FACS189421_02830 [Bacteroidia bacterium]